MKVRGIDGKRSIRDIIQEVGVSLSDIQIYLTTCLMKGIIVQHIEHFSKKPENVKEMDVQPC
ncbi:hypothetical protein ES703_43506 [subsurface metagenome]